MKHDQSFGECEWCGRLVPINSETGMCDDCEGNEDEKDN